MAISFSLDLTPNQIEFLQRLDLYADGVIPITEIGTLATRDYFTTWSRKLMREGLVEHVVPGPGQRYDGGRGNGEVIRAYRITEKGRKVLSLIADDVAAFLSRQKDYQEAKQKGRRA